MEIPVSIWLLGWIGLSFIVTPLVGRVIRFGMRSNDYGRRLATTTQPQPLEVIYPNYAEPDLPAVAERKADNSEWQLRFYKHKVRSSGKTGTEAKKTKKQENASNLFIPV